ncbi:MAG: hypothetical protein QOH12_2166 [Solirubrobacteraceae bacterium]|jgi:hypothetical protein|nr:hypothetical protein [Solirubrobacteraceae bacterium]
MTPVRPVFNDGAILAASDLTALAQIDSDRDARHARHLHTPGIANGLELSTTDRTTATGAKYIDVMVAPGYAIDGTGRELVVGAELPVSPDQFIGEIPSPAIDATVKGGVTSVWYPVFVRGVDTPLAATNGQLGCQSSSGRSQIDEDVELEFGRPGDASIVPAPPAPDAGAGTGDWKVLVGFVRYHGGIGRFVEVTTSADGAQVTTAGARAGVVIGQRGRIELQPETASGVGAPVVVVDDTGGGSLVFGLRNASGAVDKLMSVDSSGNLAVAGRLLGTQTSGKVLVTSGTAFDGTILPLPAGADAKGIASGALAVSVLVSPRRPQNPQLAPSQRFVSAECRVDEDRRVHCWGTWWDWTDPGFKPIDASAACDYLLLVSVGAGGA